MYNCLGSNARRAFYLFVVLPFLFINTAFANPQHSPELNPIKAHWVEIPRDEESILYQRFLDVGRKSDVTNTPSGVHSFIMAYHDDPEEDSRSYVFSIIFNCSDNTISADEMFVYSKRHAKGKVLSIHPMSREFTPLAEKEATVIKEQLCTTPQP